MVILSCFACCCLVQVASISGRYKHECFPLACCAAVVVGWRVLKPPLSLLTASSTCCPSVIFASTPHVLPLSLVLPCVMSLCFAVVPSSAGLALGRPTRRWCLVSPARGLGQLVMADRSGESSDAICLLEIECRVDVAVLPYPAVDPIVVLCLVTCWNLPLVVA